MGDRELESTVKWRPRCYVFLPKLSVWSPMPTSLWIQETEKTNQEKATDLELLKHWFSVSALISETGKAKKWMVNHHKMAARSSQFMQNWRQWLGEEQCWEHSSPVLSIPKSQASAMEDMLKEKAIGTFKAALKTQCSTGWELQTSWVLAALKWKLQLDSPQKSLILQDRLTTSSSTGLKEAQAALQRLCSFLITAGSQQLSAVH